MLIGCTDKPVTEPGNDEAGMNADAAVQEQEAKEDEPYTDGQVNVRNPETVNWDSEKSIVQTAIDNQTMIIQFMSGEGCYITNDSGNTTKWGDAVLIVFPNGETMLIDAGMGSYGQYLVENLKKLGIEKLDYFMLSHMHGDHYYGAVAADGVFYNFEVENYIWTGVYSLTYGTGNFRLWMEEAAKHYGAKEILVAEGDEMWFGDVKMTILAPQQGLVGTYSEQKTDEADNAVSIVARFDYGEFSYLTAGDLYMSEEYKILERVEPSALNVDVVKINHHGRPTSSSDEWCAAVSAKVAVATGSIDVANTTYGSYAKVGTVPYVDTYDGFVRVEGQKDGSFSLVTSRERVHDAYDALDKKYNIQRKAEY